jgi:hypothetical protein
MAFCNVGFGWPAGAGHDSSIVAPEVQNLKSAPVP